MSVSGALIAKKGWKIEDILESPLFWVCLGIVSLVLLLFGVPYLTLLFEDRMGDLIEEERKINEEWKVLEEHGLGKYQLYIDPLYERLIMNRYSQSAVKASPYIYEIMYNIIRLKKAMIFSFTLFIEFWFMIGEMISTVISVLFWGCHRLFIG